MTPLTPTRESSHLPTCHALDCMIAATALERGAALVTGDALFARLAALEPELRVVSWTGG